MAGAPAQAGFGAASLADAEVVAHVQRTGDVPAKIGEWIGQRGSRLWIEGFSLTPRNGVKAADIEYPGGAGTRVDVTVDRGRQVLRQPRNGTPAVGTEVAVEGHGIQDARVQLFGDLC